MKNKENKSILYLLFPTAILVVIGAACGIGYKGTYAHETENWQQQAIAQDVVDLFIVAPVLLISGILSYGGKRIFTYILGGTLLFLVYTYMIYCFAVHFNYLFLVYCFTLGLSVYSFIYFISSFTLPVSNQPVKNNPSLKFISFFLLVIAAIFYMLWCSEIIPAIARGQMPKSLVDTGLFTNPVHVLDISIVLPGFVIVAILLLKKRVTGLLLAPLLLVFCALMDISIATLLIMLQLKGIAQGALVALLMGILSLVSAVLLYFFFIDVSRR